MNPTRPTLNPPKTTNSDNSSSGERFVSGGENPSSDLSPLPAQQSTPNLPPLNPSLTSTQSVLPPLPITQPAADSAAYISDEASGFVTMNSNQNSGISRGVIVPIMVGVFLIILAVSGFLTAAAYGRATLPNQDMQQAVERFIVGLPFMPKTPQYIMESVALADKSVTKESIDASLSVKSNVLASLLHLDEIDSSAKGNVDYTDPKNIKMDMNLNLTNYFGGEVRLINNVIYAKVNKFPSTLLTSMKLDPSKVDSLFTKWIELDLPGLNSDAAQTLSTQSDNPEADKKMADFMQQAIKGANLTSESLQGHDVYKLQINPTEEQINQFFLLSQMKSTTQRTDMIANPFQPSQLFKNMTLNLWVDKNKYLIRKVAFTFKFLPGNSSSNISSKVLGISAYIPNKQKVLGVNSSINQFSQGEYDAALVIGFSNFNHTFAIDVPQNSLGFSDFYSALEQSAQISPDSTLSVSKNSTSTATGVKTSSFPAISIEKGIYAQIQNIQIVGSQVIANIQFINTGSVNQQIYPIRVIMLSKTYGEGDRTTDGRYLNWPIAANSSQLLTFTYTKLPDPPYAIYYTNQEQQKIPLGVFSP